MSVTASPVPSAALPVVRAAISVYFFILGYMFATWASRLPAIKEKLQLSDGELGTVLLGMPIGSLLMMLLAGWLTARFGSRIVVVLAAVGYCCVVPVLGLLPSPWMLAVVLSLAGATGNLINIAANDQAVALERLYGRAIMSSFHALFSVGGMVGAALGGFIHKQSVSLFAHFAGMGLIGVALALFFARYLLAAHTDYDSSQPIFVRPDRTLVGLGLIGLCVMLGEGAMADWSSIYLSGMLPPGSGWTTAGYTAFSLAMAAGRFGGDWFANRHGTQKTLVISGLLSGCGLLLALLVQQPVVVVFGFACVGLGFATVVPLVYSAAGQSKAMTAGMAIAAVSTVSFFGFLFGPPVIGWLSEVVTLRWALLLVVGLSFAVAAMARRELK